jgi:stress-induced morphogen
MSIRQFGVLEDIESKLRAQFKPEQLKVTDPNGDLYKVNVT